MNNVVDSSGWIEYFVNSPRAKYFAEAIEDIDTLVVPALCLYEVYKKVVAERGETAALQIITQMQLGTVLDLTGHLALQAAMINKKYKLPMTDSTILATARFANATVWTQDADFKGIPDVKYFRKK